MSKTIEHAEREFAILEKLSSDTLISEFKPEMLNLIKKFAESGQSGGSAPYTAHAITDSLKKVLLHVPLSPIVGTDDEWDDVTEYFNGIETYQNKRCTELFKKQNGKPYYLNAIAFTENTEDICYTGSTYIDTESCELIRSEQTVIFPFTPKTFYIEVIYVVVSPEKIAKHNLSVTEIYGELCIKVVKNPKDLDEVFDYYEKQI